MKNIFLILFLFFTISVIAQVQNNIVPVKISGKLFSKYNKIFIANADIFFISKEKYIKTVTDENGYFELEVPQQYIKNYNLLYFNFDKVNNMPKQPQKRVLELDRPLFADEYGYRYVIFSNKEAVINKEYIIDLKFYGEPLIPVYPDYYYFNGKSISKRKFNKLRKQDSNYTYFNLSYSNAKIVSGKKDIDNCYLLFSE
ncbi:hypothetical protein N0B16_12215 [Chryseobacterium sp. GMJ5]|uniref:Carboxypeptidase regulatory-like domain-containing protein n=1 Tax=Chryseobacterium gilvum TaxID=2976534 RepID=A0ABT2VYY1_9FLAO|nr:hypothetical protein [Chryseobacterium gilvum]MCU7615204.1 hypothetical protein [Chryseobacterium gilvum]